jgi:hypothetical protein
MPILILTPICLRLAAKSFVTCRNIISIYQPSTIWRQMFLGAQGYVLDKIVLEQDRDSAIRLENNGRLSAGQKSRHIDVQYFWIKNRVQSHQIKIVHCPTLEMLADLFTKPLQGHLFCRFRDVILGYCHVNTQLRDPKMMLEERVEEINSKDQNVSKRRKDQQKITDF